MENREAFFIVEMVLRQWESQNKQLIGMMEKLSDEQLLKHVAPGKNTGRYLLGHLLAISDYLFPLFGLGERLYPSLEAIYIQNADGAITQQPSVQELRDMYFTLMDKQKAAFDTLTVSDWLSRHTRVSEEDFVKEPHRNKLNVLLNRATHQAYHLGQLGLLIEK